MLPTSRASDPIDPAFIRAKLFPLPKPCLRATISNAFSPNSNTSRLFELLTYTPSSRIRLAASYLSLFIIIQIISPASQTFSTRQNKNTIAQVLTFGQSNYSSFGLAQLLKVTYYHQSRLMKTK